MSIEILYEDNHLLVVNKPPGLATQGAAADADSVFNQAKEYLRKKYQKPGNVYLGVVSRLDSPVSGVVVFARTSKSAARLNEQFRGRSVQKIYWAVVEGRIKPDAASCADWIRKDERQQKMVLAPAPKRSAADRGKPKSVGSEQRHTGNRGQSGSAQQAKLSYRLIKFLDANSLLEIELETGRKHQIRLQLSARGYPLLGDKKYGAKTKFAGGIALHCRKMAIEHPTKKTPLEFIARPPKSWKSFET